MTTSSPPTTAGGCARDAWSRWSQRRTATDAATASTSTRRTRDKLIYGPPHFEEVAAYRHGSCSGVNDCAVCGGPVDLSGRLATFRDARDERIVKALMHVECEMFALD